MFRRFLIKISKAVTSLALPEIVWGLGRTWVVPKGVPSFVRRGEGR
jgi:hypothetical protein